MFRLRQRSSAVIVVLVLLRRLLLKLCLIVVDIIFFVLEVHNLSSSSVDRQGTILIGGLLHTYNSIVPTLVVGYWLLVLFHVCNSPSCTKSEPASAFDNRKGLLEAVSNRSRRPLLATDLLTYLPLIKSARGDNCKRNDAIVRIGEGLWVIDTVIIVYLDVVEKRLKRRGGSVSQSSLS